MRRAPAAGPTGGPGHAAARPAARPSSARLTLESAVIGLLFGVAVVAPWASGGYVLLLDWVTGPHQAITAGVYGLDPNALDALPYRLAIQALREVAGASATGWLMVLLYFPFAASGVSALAGGGRWRRHPAALFAVDNPFVAERIRAGHITFLLCVALVTWVLASAVHARRLNKSFAVRPAGWYALAMSVGPYAAWLGGAALLAVALLPRPRRCDGARTALVVVAAGCVYAYTPVVVLTGIQTMRATDLDLAAYATRAGPGGLLVTVASLHGFWRGTPGSPAGRLGPGWGGALLVVLLVAVACGLVRLCRSVPEVGRPLVALTVAGLVLGVGVEGPLGGLYRATFHVMPLFQVMREQQKWVALSMVGYSVAIGAAVEWLVGAGRTRVRLARAAHAGPWPGRVVALPAICAIYLAVAFSLVWGLGGTVMASRYPASWYAADRLMGTGTGAVLFLPWHEYQPFDFTGGRDVATPARAFFRRPVISSDAVEIGPLRTDSISRRLAYVTRLVADGGHGHLGRLVAPLGVAYVVLARDREADAYAWLSRQPDLRPVLHTAQLDVYQVEPAGTGRVVSARAGDYEQAVTLAEGGQLGTEAVLSGGAAGGPVPSTGSGRMRRTSSTGWRVEPGTAGWVVVPEEWSAGWRLDGRPGHPTVAGTIAFPAGSAAATVEYLPWRWLRLGIAVSLASLAALVAAGFAEHRRELSGWTAVGMAAVRHRAQ